MTIKIDEKEGLVYLHIDEYEGIMKTLQDHENRIKALELRLIGN